MVAVTKDAVDAVAAGSRERDGIVASIARDLSVVAASVEELHRWVAQREAWLENGEGSGGGGVHV
jgi:hypothetical protein